MISRATHLNRFLVQGNYRFMSAASTASIKSRFQAAYEERVNNLQKTPQKTQEPKNKAKYGSSYYADKAERMGKGYTHPYHSADAPIFMSSYAHMRMLFDAVGPEQVSPHYETLTRSRRGLILMFIYFEVVGGISALGGYKWNDQLDAMMFYHKFLIALFCASTETRHFFWTPGPKFTIFYNTYIRYEYTQLCNQWADVVEQKNKQHLIPTKEQMEYMRINDEYEFVKKRALVNFLSNSRNELERHFHSRTTNMLNSIERFEGNNLKQMLNSIVSNAVSKVNQALEDPQQRERILQASFESALIGIRTGKMEYVNDPILPILTEEINRRTAEFKSLTPAQESKLLALTAEQKRFIADSDKKAKEEYLNAMPQINNPGVKMNAKFKSYVQSIGASAH